MLSKQQQDSGGQAEERRWQELEVAPLELEAKFSLSWHL